MRSVYVLLCTFCTMVLVGCSNDRNDLLIAKTNETLRGTTAEIEQITKTLTEAVTQAKKDGKPLALDKILKATEECAGLTKQAKILQQIKGETEVQKELITKEQREDYARHYKKAFQDAMVDLDNAQKKLDIALREADTASTDNESKAGMEKLVERLKESQTEFEVLTKRQS